MTVDYLQNKSGEDYFNYFFSTNQQTEFCIWYYIFKINISCNKERQLQVRVLSLTFINMVMARLKQNSVCIVLFFLFIESGCTSLRMEKDFYNYVLGVSAIPEKQLFLYDEESANNNGFSFEIIRLSLDDDPKFTKGYPVSDEFRKDMQISRWKKHLH
ncbi:hypothetical protein ACR78G_12740 [Sphingobacterium spiritivorum]|uniref:hypothetical protein n=1 Tax=Sphingobacterium spiritivorum TaxID=258 RepID=UPI003DA41465